MKKSRYREIADQNTFMPNRSAVAISVKHGDKLELTNGVSIVFKRRAGRNTIIVLVDKGIGIYRPMKEDEVEQTDIDQG